MPELTKTKLAAQLREDGLFLGTTIVDEDPANPGHWLMPVNAIEQLPPPEADAGIQYWWNADAGEYRAEVDDPKAVALQKVKEMASHFVHSACSSIAELPAWKSLEYQVALENAEAHLSGGYPTEDLQAFADYQGLSNHDAAVRIIAAAHQGRMRVQKLRALRFICLRQIREATDPKAALNYGQQFETWARMELSL